MTTQTRSSAQRAELVDLARKLLKDGRVEAVIGYRRGPGPLTAVPHVAKTPADADALIFDATCEFNLANFLHRHKPGKVAIVVKGCDERSVIGLVQERMSRADGH